MKLQRQRVQQRELSDAQEYLTGSFPLTIETPSAIALQVLNAVFYGLDLNELQTYRERVNAITVDDIQRVAQQYLHPDKLSIVLVGDASVFAKQLSGVGFDQVERIPIAELDLASPDLERHAAPRPGRVSSPSCSISGPWTVRHDRRSRMVRRALISRAVAAKGGLNLLRSIQTVRAESVATVQSEGMTTDLPSTTTHSLPGSFRIDATTPAGPAGAGVQRGQILGQDRSGIHDAPESMACGDPRKRSARHRFRCSWRCIDGKVTRRRQRIAEDGRTMPTLEVALPAARR